MKKEKIVFIGGGEHCSVVLHVLKKRIKASNLNLEIMGIIDNKKAKGTEVAGVPVIGDDQVLCELKDTVSYAFISMGMIEHTGKREQLYHDIKKAGFSSYTILSVDSIIDPSVHIGEGSIIMPGAVINCNVTIGKNVIVNTGTIIDHDCIIGDHVHLAPGVTLSGRCSIGKNTLVGTGSSIIQHIDIGANTVIGAGSVVVKNIENNVIAYGNPCRVIKKNEE